MHADTPLSRPAGARAQPLASGVQGRIEALILSGALKPGECLNEVVLARQLGVSRGPVREAARALERTGLVTVIMNRGAFVRSMGIDEVMETYELNAVLANDAGLARRHGEAHTRAGRARFLAAIDYQDTAPPGRFEKETA